MTSLTSSAAAWAQPTFPVMNTSETPPDGVYFRPGPDQTTGTTTDGVGVYVGEHVRVKCYWNGRALGPYNNTVWYYAYDVERPTVAGRSNEGWINTHYVQDQMTAGNAAPGVPQCMTGTGDGGTVGGDDGGGGSGGGSSGGDAGGPTNASVFYAGDPPDDGYDLVSSATTKRRKSQWYASGCKATSRNPAASYGDTIDGRKVTTLAGFSSGRLGVLYYLRTSPSRGANVTRIVLFDPGNKSDLTGGCDDRASQTLASWLRRVPGAELIILAGKRTAQKRHQGIQDIYFAPAIRGTGVAKQVIVCNLNGWDHTDVVKGYQHFVGSPPSACPHEYVQWSP
jgi:hypothetical protein